MQQRRILFYLCLAAAGMTCGSLMIGSIGASRNRPELEPNAMDPVHSTQISSHVKSVDKYQDEAQLSASTAPLKGPAGPDVVASITHQIPIVDEVSEGLSDWPQTADPVSPSPTGDAQAIEVTVANSPKRERIGPSRRVEKSSRPQLKAPSPQQNAGTYGAQVRALLSRQPRAAAQSGSATVIFAIDQTGSLRYARISHSSDNPVLDDAALATVRNAAPFPPPPRALNVDDLAYSIEIGFPGSSGRPPSRQ